MTSRGILLAFVFSPWTISSRVVSITSSDLSSRRCVSRIALFQRRSVTRASLSLTMVEAEHPGYEAMCTRLRDIAALSEVSELLGWDEQVMMPKGSAESRAAQKSAMAAVIHERKTADALKTAMIEAAKEKETLDLWESAVVREAERNWQLAQGVSTELERRIAEQEVLGVQAWVQARENNDFAAFEPHLRRSVKLAREYARASRPELDPYDGAIDIFERGMTAARLSEIFQGMVEPLRTLLKEIVNAQQQIADIDAVHPALEGGEAWVLSSQAEFCKEIAESLGYDYDRGRIGKSLSTRWPRIFHRF